MHSYSIGIDLGGTSVRIAAYRSGTDFMETIVLPTRVREGSRAVAADICGAVHTLTKLYAHLHLAGIALGCPGPLELPMGRMLHPPNFPGWHGVELRSEIEAAVGQPIIIENDANAAAFAEARLGQGSDQGSGQGSGHGSALALDSLCMLTLGTGVGNGIILDGKIWHGMNGMGGEAGHATIWPDGPACGCGSNGCLEVFASATAAVRMAKEQIALGNAPALQALAAQTPAFTAHDLYLLAKSGDRAANAVFETVGRALGIGIGALVNTLNLPLFVVGGGLAEAWDVFSPWMFHEMRHRSYVYRLTDPDAFAATVIGGKTQVLRAALGPNAGLLGACLLPFYLPENSHLLQNDSLVDKTSQAVDGLPPVRH